MDGSKSYLKQSSELWSKIKQKYWEIYKKTGGPKEILMGMKQVNGPNRWICCCCYCYDDMTTLNITHLVHASNRLTF
jgi:hypothetical protein